MTDIDSAVEFNVRRTRARSWLVAGSVVALVGGVVIASKPANFVLTAPTGVWFNRVVAPLADPPAPSMLPEFAREGFGRFIRSLREFDGIAQAVTPEPEPLARPYLEVATVPVGLEQVREGATPVPASFPPTLPTVLLDTRFQEDRKSAFVKALLPHLLRANDRIREDRLRLVRVKQDRDRGYGLSADDEAFLSALAERYDVEDDRVAELLRRVDIVPVSLAIAQAAEETGWGSSRSAHSRNALFGEMTVTSQGRLAVRAFGGIEHAVTSYVMNLNTHRAYREMRQARAKLRQQGKEPTGLALVGTLQRYSERGTDYTRAISSVIRVNGLVDFDSAKLHAADLTVAEVRPVWQ